MFLEVLYGTEAHTRILEGTTRHSPCPSACMCDTKVLAGICQWETSVSLLSSSLASHVDSVLVAHVGKGS